VRAARAVSCVSRPISELVVQGYGYHGPIEVIENAVPAGIFYPRDRKASRRMLGLPEDAKLVGVAGAISASRGIGVLFQGCARLALRLPDLNLVIAGPRDGSVRIPRDAWTHDLGILPLEQVPVLLSALDLAVICNLDSAFGRYSFPQKFHEIIACGTPVLAAAVGALAERLAPWPQCLYVPDDDASLAQTMQVQLEDPQRPTIVPPRWEDMARRLERLVGEVN
jgi:teichuronic acid biosynthesis glycosyltransferase TuaC